MQDDDKVDENPPPGEGAAQDTLAPEVTPPEPVAEEAPAEAKDSAGAEAEPQEAPAGTEAEATATEPAPLAESGESSEAPAEPPPAHVPAEGAELAEPDGAQAAPPADGSEVAPDAQPGSVEGSEAPTSDADLAAPAEGLAEADVLPDELPATSSAELRAIVEALVFVAPQPLTLRELGRVLPGIERSAIRQALAELHEDYAREGRGLHLVEVAAGWQITTRPEYNDRVRELIDPRAPTRLSIQALQTLAVIAYKQPVTLPEVIDLRGVKSGGVVKTLLDKRLIKIVGRKEVVGRPILYGTTKEFLLHFGMKDLSELPRIEEFAEVLGEEVDVIGLKRAIETPRPAEVPLSEEPPVLAEDEPGSEPAPAADQVTEES